MKTDKPVEKEIQTADWMRFFLINMTLYTSYSQTLATDNKN